MRVEGLKVAQAKPTLQSGDAMGRGGQGPEGRGPGRGACVLRPSSPQKQDLGSKEKQHRRSRNAFPSGLLTLSIYLLISTKLSKMLTQFLKFLERLSLL